MGGEGSGRHAALAAGRAAYLANIAPNGSHAVPFLLAPWASGALAHVAYITLRPDCPCSSASDKSAHAPVFCHACSAIYCCTGYTYRSVGQSNQSISLSSKWHRNLFALSAAKLCGAELCAAM